mmetsp:Transcript_92708/g.145550  ORF Transcript_92708/g.145550 Transcript_92708/m.145550 type:complete len:204 (-) Transcript_92708:205-816(-)
MERVSAYANASSGALTESLRGELDTLLAETRYEAILEALEVWRCDPGRPREGVLALEQMAGAGLQPQTFDWPDLDYPATLSEVCGSLVPSPCSTTSFDTAPHRYSNLSVGPTDAMRSRPTEQLVQARVEGWGTPQSNLASAVPGMPSWTSNGFPSRAGGLSPSPAWSDFSTGQASVGVGEPSGAATHGHHVLGSVDRHAWQHR